MFHYGNISSAKDCFKEALRWLDLSVTHKRDVAWREIVGNRKATASASLRLVRYLKDSPVRIFMGKGMTRRSGEKMAIVVAT